MGERKDLIEMQTRFEDQHPFALTIHDQGLVLAALTFAASNYATTIASLSEALAEAEKKGAEDWQPIETAPRDGTPFLGWDGYSMWPCAKVEDGPVTAIGQRVIGIMCGSDVRLWRPLPAPPRDLSQGGQHG